MVPKNGPAFFAYPAEILYDDNHLLAIHKPAGWLVQGDHTGDPTLTDWAKAWVKSAYQKPGEVFLHPTHRIDRPVSGVVLFARTSKSLARMNALFKSRDVQKRYIAIVLNPPPAPKGTLKHYLIKDKSWNFVTAYEKPDRDGLAKESTLHYTVLGTKNGLTYLSINPITGRPHQIRVQLAAMGCPILGDLKYGAPEALPDLSIGLHCKSMAFLHPVKQELLTIEAPNPLFDFRE